MAATLVMVERMTAQGLALDVVGYNTLVAEFCHSGDADVAWEVAERMKADGVEPSVVTHTALIGECCKMKQIEEAFTLYEGMVRSGMAGSQRHMHFSGMCRMMMLFGGNLHPILEQSRRLYPNTCPRKKNRWGVATSKDGTSRKWFTPKSNRIIDFGHIDKFSVHELIILDEKNDEVRKISSRVNDLDLQLMKN
ncbi:Pentatricopeptide repeat-containing protein [Zea mays]|uniref:Pentatricopeptide repeat-containing protein n=1 Tax=Zea mays TaxID=4577 RepID=A0A3L6FWH5_MAIZE|nr:Pentatricopeptide repeat-containing protein [Zea mays]